MVVAKEVLRLSMSALLKFILCIFILVMIAALPLSSPIIAAEVNPKLETILQELAEQWLAGLTTAQDFAQERGIAFDGDTVKVIIEPVGRDPSAIDQTALWVLGATVEAASKSLMRAEIPIPQLITVANTVRGISFIRRPYRPHAAAIISEGVSKTKASNYHSEGYYGQKVKIAVIDLGFEGLSEAIRNGEFGTGAGYSGSAVIDHSCSCDLTSVYDASQCPNLPPNLERWTDHGTAVAEIIHDMAPQATLCLMRIKDERDLEDAVAFAKSKGVKIINHSVTWFNTNFYDGTGIIAETAADARDKGILWVNAAGNAASGKLEGHWQGPFTNSDSDRYLDFGPGRDPIDGDSIDECNDLSASAGERINIFLTWDDWNICADGTYRCSDQDYDLELYDSSGNEVYRSANYQGGTQNPAEYISYDVKKDDTYCFAIHAKDAPRRPNLELYIFKDNHVSNLNLEYHHPQSSIPAPGNSAKVFTVGAISADHNNWEFGEAEYFSSRGPTNTSKHTTSITKPDIMGPDRVSTYTYSGKSFSGTSAAAPHVAGAAALLLSWLPGWSPDYVQGFLERRAMDVVDLGDPGKDNTYGSGRLSLVRESPPPEMKIYAEDAQVRVGEMVAVPIIMNDAPYGLSGYRLEVSLEDGTIADIVSVEFVAFGGAHIVELSPHRDSVTFQATDFASAVQPGAKEVTLALVNFQGLQGGTIEIQIEPIKLDADGGANLLPATSIKNGTLTVLERTACLPDPISRSRFPPYDLDDDGLCEDVNGNGRLDFDDAVSLALNIDSNVIQNNRQMFDFNSNRRADFDDAVQLAFMVGGQAAAQALLRMFGQFELEVTDILVYPNPVASGNAVHFVVEGQGVAAIKAEVYDLSGARVYDSDFVAGNRLSWNLTNERGDALANGVYLYILTIKGYSDELVRSEVKKLVVLR